MTPKSHSSYNRRAFLKKAAIVTMGLSCDARLPGQTPRESRPGSRTAVGQKNSLASPVNAYQAEVLLLAPPDGEDLNTLSLLAQFLELGVAVELDENWRLPRQPPKELSKYRACIFPEHPEVVRQYGKDLDAYIRAGGFVPYTKYFPVQNSDVMTGVHHYFQSYGRDDYMYHLANVTLGTTLTVPSVDFRNALRARSTQSMMAEYRAGYLAEYAGKDGRWVSWGDPGFTEFLVNFELAQSAGDEQWLAAFTRCVERLCATVPEYLSDRYRFQELKAPDAVDVHAAMMGEILMYYGHQLHRREWLDAGIQLARYYMEGNRDTWRNEINYGTNNWQTWSESLLPLPIMTGLARFDGQRHFTDKVDRMMRAITRRNLTEGGLWRHWTDDQGGKGAIWSRGVQWGLLWPTRVLMTMEDRGGGAAEFMIDTAKRVFDGLAPYQDPESGLWRMVIDEPHTRIESTGAAGIIYCHDQLRKMGAIDGRHDAMIERAFVGMKGLWYRGGVASSCRGTSTGVPEYYRTRPMGYYSRSLYPAGFANRRA